MEYFYCSLAVLAVLYASGLGFTLLLLPEATRRYALIIAPWVGFCYIGLACWPVFYYGGQITRQTAGLILFVPVLCLVIELFRKRWVDVGREIRQASTLAALAVAAAGFAVLSIPVFWNTDYLTTISLGNNDIATYGMVSRYLSEFSKLSTEGFVGQLAVGPNPLQLVAAKFYFGTPAFISVVDRVLGLPPHEDLSMATFLFSALGGSVVFILLHERLRVGVTAGLIGVAFVTFHPMLQFIALEGFFAQVVGTGLGLLIFWGNAKLLDRRNTNRDRAKLCLLVTLFSCGLLLNYAHMFVFIWFFIGIYALALALLERSLYPIKICVGANIVVALLTALILPQRVQPFFDMFKVYGTATAGWFIPWMSPDYLVGLMYKNPFLEVGSDSRWRLAFSILVGLVFLVGLFIAHRKGYYRIVAVGLAGGAVYGGCLLLAVMGSEGGVWGGYKSFKLVSFFLPFFALALVSVLAIVKFRFKLLAVVIKSVVVMAVVGGYVMADRIMLRPARYLRVEPEYESLRGLERNHGVKSVNVYAGDYWPTMWVAYFLIHKKLYLQNPSYYILGGLVGDYDLVDKVSLTSAILRVKSVEARLGTQLNDRFLMIGPVRGTVRAKLGTGWHLGETHHVWSGKEGKRSSIILHSQKDGMVARLKISCSPLRANDNLTVLFRGEPLLATTATGPDGRKEIRIAGFVLDKGDNEVNLVSELEPTQANAADPRPVSYCFSAVEVEEL